MTFKQTCTRNCSTSIISTKQILNQPLSVYLDCKPALIRSYWVPKWGKFERHPGSGSSLCNRRLVPYHLGQGWQFSSWTSRSLLGHPHHSTSTVTIVNTNLIKHFLCVLLLGDGKKGKRAKHLTPNDLLHIFIVRQSLQSLCSIKKCKYGQYQPQSKPSPNLKIYVTKFLLQCLLKVRQDH